MWCCVPSLYSERPGLAKQQIPIQTQLADRGGTLEGRIRHRIEDIPRLGVQLRVAVYERRKAVNALRWRQGHLNAKFQPIGTAISIVIQLSTLKQWNT